MNERMGNQPNQSGARGDLPFDWSELGAVFRLNWLTEAQVTLKSGCFSKISGSNSEFTFPLFTTTSPPLDGD